ncbi:Mre11 complex subunit Nbs1 [Ancistrocladus abbreviatus]
MDLLRAVISGYLDLSIFISPSIVSSSCSTDETIVVDSDAETKSATSDQLVELDRKGEGSGDDVALSSRRDDQKTNSVEHNDRTVIRTAIQSRNSFNNLVPFAKHPYTDSDYESKEVIEYVREEKKRKQMEAIAEDLFNNEKARRRGALGSLRGLLISR